MSGESTGPGGLPPLGQHGQFGEAGTPPALESDETLPPQDAPPPPEQQAEASAPLQIDQWLTQELPADYRPTPALSPRIVDADPRRRHRSPVIIAVSVLLAVVLIGGGVFAATRGHAPARGSTATVCAPCQAAGTYITDYTGGNYEAMYTLTSTASRQRFSDPAILSGTPYKDAHAYIVDRTNDLLTAAEVYSMSATVGKVQQSSPTAASAPVQVVMSSSRVGTITQDITIPLVKENGQWRVTWSPGLIFTQLDDPTYDPQYRRRVHLFPQDATRGTIYDRDGNVLAQDTSVYVVGVVPGQIQNETALLTALSANLDMTPEQIKARYQNAAASDFVAIRTITPQLYGTIQNTITPISGVQVQSTTGRVYPYGADAAAATGYVGQVSENDLKNDTSHYYYPAANDVGGVIGRAGVEAWGNQYLRPVKGGKLDIMNVNADGSYAQPAYTIAERDAANGDDIHTTISIADQQAAMAQMRKFSSFGSGAVALDPATGDVRVLASYPIYDPNDFSLGFTPNEQARFDGLDHPYLNRAISSAVPIGSVFKLVTLSAALQNGVKTSDIFTCTGKYQVPGESQPRNDDLPTGHGSLTAPAALGPSCDVIFWQVAVLLNSHDPTILPTTAKAFGYGTPTGMIGVPQGAESAGLVPDPQWLKQQQNAQWTATDAANLGIGQGFFQATPAQVASATAAIANNGVRMQPRLVTSVTTSTGATAETIATHQVGTLPLSADNLQVLQVAMLGTTSLPSGTSYTKLHAFPVRVAGKTGSAESGQPHPHSWFTCYAPASPLSGPPVTPQIALAAIVQYSDYGEKYAVPVAVSILHADLKV